MYFIQLKATSYWPYIYRIQVAPKIIQTSLHAFGKIDGLVINHGVIAPLTKISESSAEEWRRAYDINVFSAVALVSSATWDQAWPNALTGVGKRSDSRIEEDEWPCGIYLFGSRNRRLCRLGSLRHIKGSCQSYLCTHGCGGTCHHKHRHLTG